MGGRKQQEYHYHEGIKRKRSHATEHELGHAVHGKAQANSGPHGGKTANGHLLGLDQALYKYPGRGKIQ